MAKRATLFDSHNREIAHLRYAEIDDYLQRGFVERLTSVRSTQHQFRLLISPLEVDGMLFISETTLTAEISQANAGASNDIIRILWARRKVRKWPFVGDTFAIRIGCKA